MSTRRALSAIGRTMISLGLLLLLFVAYQLWGTGITEARHQAALRSQFQHELNRSRSTSTTTPSRASTSDGGDAATIGTAPAAPGDGQPIGEIDIPKIGLDKVIVQGTSTDDLRLGPGHYVGTPFPGQPGNAAIAGHRTTYGAPFYNLNQLTVGDPIDVTTLQGHFVYHVVSSTVVLPTNNTVLDPTTVPTLTLTTCNPRWSSSQRLVVQAVLTSSPAKATPTKPGKRRRRSSGDLAGSTQGSVAAPVLWGAGLVAATTAVWLLARRRTHRWLLYTAGAVPVLVVLFFFFASLSPLLPASF